MKVLILVVLSALSMSLLTGCSQKDSNGNPTPDSFSSTGMFNRTGGDVVGGN